jgi:hypothetical protein
MVNSIIQNHLLLLNGAFKFDSVSNKNTVKVHIDFKRLIIDA